MHLIRFEETHWGDAASLVATRMRVLQSAVPVVPDRYTDATAIYARLSDLAARVPGIAAVQNGKLVGFLLGMAIPAIRGQRAVYVPEWANGAVQDDARDIYQAMYAALAPRWLANGCYLHALTLLTSDSRGLDGLYWQGFGLYVVDALRDLSPVQGEFANVPIRQATAHDLDDVSALGDALQRHLAASPIFLAFTQPTGRDDYAGWLATPHQHKWLAFQGDAVVAEMGTAPASPAACTIIDDPGTTSIVSAFTHKAARGSGVATALLDRVLTAGRDGGYLRCAVDFESANIVAARFWMRHFRPICYSVIRVVDQRMAFAHAHRSSADLW